ncbi:MAG: AAA family ATPase [Candidatus Hodarchaeota archaeon]
MMTINEILEIKNSQIIKKQKIIQEIGLLETPKFVLQTGARNFDETLGGGFHSHTQYLIFGANKTGKTQLCHQLCVQAYMQFSNIYENQKRKKYPFIFYLDTENTFRPERIKELILKSKVEYKELLRNILVSKIMSNSALLLALKQLENLLKTNYLSVLIIDTINNYYNSELANKSISVNKTKSTFLKVLDKIEQYRKNYNLITISTAQISSNLGIKTSIRALPGGYKLLNQYFSEYIYLSYKEQDKRYVQIINSLNLPEKRLLYKITSLGIQDYKI